MQNKTVFKISTLSAAVASALASGPVSAQEARLEEVIVTATRRAESIQDIPINITALSSDLIERQRLTNLSDIARVVPGLTLVDQGPRSATVRAISNPTIVQVITQAEFEALCEKNSRIGYIVIRNIAADLSFRLRQRHLSDRG